ncbi:MAG: BNR-4 repeat-containing protein [Armatimonadia bacterium]
MPDVLRLATYRPLRALLLLSSLTLAGYVAAQPSATEVTAVQKSFSPLLGGCGGAYFLAEPGELRVEVAKRDRNVRDTATVMRVLLVSPDRRVLQEETIADDGRPTGSGLGPQQQVQLSTRVERRGVYAVNVTVSNDRYGYEMFWSFRSNCPRYIIETARGHKDERHQEPIVLGSPEQPADICFLPRQGELNLDASGLRAQAGPLQVFDSRDNLLATLPVDATGKTSHTFPAGESREVVPWRLHLPAAQGVLNADGLTRGDKGDAIPNLCCWSPDPASWFPLQQNRWLLTPYHRTAYAAPGATGEFAFQVRNDAKQPREVQLRLEFAGQPWSATLSTDRVALKPGETAPVTVRYTAPADKAPHSCHVIASPQNDERFSTYSTLTVMPGEAPAARPLAMPIMLKPYAHENEQFGYSPGYPLDNQLYFDAADHPCTQVPGGVAVLRDGQWRKTDFASAVTSRTPAFEGNDFAPQTTKIAFDADGDMYLLARCGATAALLHSADQGRTFAAYALPGGVGGYDLEQFSGHNVPAAPPAIVRFLATVPQDPKLKWRRVHDLELFAPVKHDGRLEIGAPHLVSRQCLGFSGHSGMPSSVVSRGDKIHVVWGEATDPAVTVPGVPTYVATFNRATGELSAPALVGYGPPANDVHNTPSITMDGDGYLHVLVGTHGRPFQYARSLKPNDASAGWTEPAAAAEGQSQTYVGFVCGPDNTLHVTFRLWRYGEFFPGASGATLAYQRKRPGQPWEAPRVLVVAPFSEYSVFYHRLTSDHAGRLFLSYDYWSTHWFYRNDHPGNRRAVLMSPDGGDTWQLAADRDLQ